MRNNRTYVNGVVPTLKYARSKFDLSHNVKTSFNLGQLIPVDFEEVLPGDNFKMKVTGVFRTSSPFIKPIMDNIVIDLYHFYVPYRLIYDDYESVYGNSSPSAYDDGVEGQFPMNYGNSETVSAGSLGDYFGLSLGNYVNSGYFSILPFRAYALIVDKWFRNENVTDEIYVQKGETVSSEALNSNAFSQNNYTGLPFVVTKKSDYFTSCLPSPQKGGSVILPFSPDTAPVVLNTSSTISSFASSNPLKFSGNGTSVDAPLFVGASNSQGALKVDTSSGSTLSDYGSVTGTNLVASADLSQVSGLDVNEFRILVANQRMLEKDARYGSRYNEYIYGHYGVFAPDARIQIPEYLGGGSIPLNIYQVPQTSEGSSTSPMAELSGFSWSAGSSRFSKGFTEPGLILTLACARQYHTYSQGIRRFWKRSKRSDFYDPTFAHIGEQPVYVDELYGQGLSVSQWSRVFGYQEAWADYRQRYNFMTGNMRISSGSLGSIWTLGDNFSVAPTLSDSFISETSSNIDRCLSVETSSMDNFIADFWFDEKAVRCMPTFSTPGLVDHG